MYNYWGGENILSPPPLFILGGAPPLLAPPPLSTPLISTNHKSTATAWGKQKETLMVTGKSVMIPTLEYASSILSFLASPTSINKLQVMQKRSIKNCTGCTQYTNIQHLHDKTLTLPIHEHLTLHASQYKQKPQHPSHRLHKHTTYYKQKTQHPSHPLHNHRTYFNTPRLNHYFQQRPIHKTPPTEPPHSHYNRNKNNKHAPYTCIYCLQAYSHKRQ